MLLRNNFSLWGYHNPGTLNYIADILSRFIEEMFEIILSEIVNECNNINAIPSSPCILQDLPYQLHLWTTSTLQSVTCGEPLKPALAKQS